MRAQEVPAYVVEDRGTVIVLCDKSSPGKWPEQVADEFKPACVVFVWSNGGKWTATEVRQWERFTPSRTNLELAAAFLAREGKLGPGDDVEFRCEPPADPACAASERVVVPLVCPKGTRERILTVEGMNAWITQENPENIEQMVQSLRSPTGVIPFLGAGTSAGFGYPLWGDFFKEFANDAAAGAYPAIAKLSQEDRDSVIALVNDQRFEKAAGILETWNKPRFHRTIEEKFGGEPKLGRKRTNVTKLPLIAPGPIITTNVDSVIEAVYEKMGTPFPEDRRILGARNENHPVRVVAALQQNSCALIKLHGDANHSDSLVFSEVEYEAGYGNTDKPGDIERLATVIYTNRPLLFLGCSLETDRTVKSLERVYKRNPFVGHYAILAPPFRSTKRDKRVKRLRTKLGVRPLWFRPGKYADIGDLLDHLVSKTALDEITPRSVGPVAAPPITTVVSDDRQLGLFPDLTQAHFESVTKALITGKLIFFLGAAVHTNRWHGQEFYEEICRRNQIPWPRRDRADAAQYAADLDRTELSKTVKSIIQANCAQVCRAHEFVAALSSKLQQLKRDPVMIITTNYDAMTEAAFVAAGQPFHLFVYNHDGLHAGRFLYRRPDGHEFAIRTPAAIQKPLKEPVIVKLNGGIDLLGHWLETFVVAGSDFEELSTRLPYVLPQVVWDALKKRSILFLGHGLREPDVRSLVRRRKREGAPPSWAVHLGKADVPYLQAIGIKLIEADVDTYLNRLESKLAASLPSWP